ncbi:MAG: hypothetical protein OEQ25_01815 [Gammaproteobacteria bacterium]|nr:hypothetical protein [Gammaproteobacteria bacterium]MDH3505852.1 hypothetical protein [Gammaproteobacteria bacterium]
MFNLNRRATELTGPGMGVGVTRQAATGTAYVKLGQTVEITVESERE